MGFLIALVIVELIIIFLLLKRKPQTITILKDAEQEEKLKYQEIYNAKTRELDRQLTEEKKVVSDSIHAAELESLKRISEKEQALAAQIRLRENNLSDEARAKEIELAKAYEELKLKVEKEHKEYMALKSNEFERKIQEIESKIIVESDAATQQIKQYEIAINEWRSKYDAAVQGFKNLEKLKEAENYNKISFSPEELDELDELNKVMKHLKNPLPLYKAIYEIYYKNKVNDLVMRVVGNDRVSGIYKITHIDSGKCYVGQSVDIGDRWKQHIKRGVGAEPLTNNKLYPAMMELGIHNFMFEIVETTTDMTKLNAMEKYWQEFYQAKEFGYSIK